MIGGSLAATGISLATPPVKDRLDGLFSLSLAYLVKEKWTREAALLEWGQLITLSMMAVALGMDAFSLGLGLGMKRLPYSQMVIISLSIGLFHVLMPLIGMIIGQYVSMMMKEVAILLGGGMLCFLGGKMLFQQNEEHVVQIQSMIQILMLSTSVSLDSLSAGLTLGLFAADKWIAISLFGGIGALMAGMGLSVGKFAGAWLGNAGETLGGIILILLGLKFIW